jgi:hypothetical protein
MKSEQTKRHAIFKISKAEIDVLFIDYDGNPEWPGPFKIEADEYGLPSENTKELVYRSICTSWRKAFNEEIPGYSLRGLMEYIEWHCEEISYETGPNQLVGIQADVCFYFSPANVAANDAA